LSVFFACLAPKYDKPTAWSASPQVLGQFAKPPIYLYADSGHHSPFEVMAYLSLACNLVILFACFTHQFSALPPRMADTTRYILPTWLPSSVFNATRILGYLRFSVTPTESVASTEIRPFLLVQPINVQTLYLPVYVSLPEYMAKTAAKSSLPSTKYSTLLARPIHHTAPHPPQHRNSDADLAVYHRWHRMMSSPQRRKSGVRHGRVPRRVPGVVRFLSIVSLSDSPSRSKVRLQGFKAAT
jgi:hypothetical protein